MTCEATPNDSNYSRVNGEGRERLRAPLNATVRNQKGKCNVKTTFHSLPRWRHNGHETAVIRSSCQPTPYGRPDIAASSQWCTRQTCWCACMLKHADLCKYARACSYLYVPEREGSTCTCEWTKQYTRVRVGIHLYALRQYACFRGACTRSLCVVCMCVRISANVPALRLGCCKLQLLCHRSSVAV